MVRLTLWHHQNKRLTKQGYIKPPILISSKSQECKMFDYRNFDEVFEFDPEYSYDSSTVESIEANRRSLEGLFVDKIFKLLDIKRRM